MILLLIGIVLYVIGGVTVFRRTGHAAIDGVDEAKKLVNKIGSHHGYNCWRGNMHSNLNYGCDCSFRYKARAFLPGVFVLTMIAWPGYIAVWGVSNSIRMYSRLRGKDTQFFVPAPRVKTQAELLAESEVRTKALEIQIKALEEENLR